MAITRQKKEELVALYKEKIENSSAIVFTEYRGTSVSRLQALRASLGEKDTQYLVVKNTLFNMALSESERPAPEELLTGPNAIAFLGEDIGVGVSALQDFIKTADHIRIKGAILDSDVLDAERAESLADLPSKEETLSMVLGAISAPASALVRIISAPQSSLVRVINAYVQKQEEAA